jgi:hypothetical protein
MKVLVNHMSYRYDRAFFDFAVGYGERSAGTFLNSVVQVAFDGASPMSVVDVGCGPGVWLAEWSRIGVKEVPRQSLNGNTHPAPLGIGCGAQRRRLRVRK